jgi:hypothetical protein
MKGSNKKMEKNDNEENNNEYNEKEITNDDDFVMIERNGEIISGGFNINSLLLKYKQSPMHTLNKKQSGGANGNVVSDIFKDLAVPAGIFYNPTQTGGSMGKEEVVQEGEVEDDLYDKLVKMASVETKSSANSNATGGKKSKKTRKASVSVSKPAPAEKIVSGKSKMTKKHRPKLKEQSDV